jgi:hypothetical protein
MHTLEQHISYRLHRHLLLLTSDSCAAFRYSHAVCNNEPTQRYPAAHTLAIIHRFAFCRQAIEPSKDCTGDPIFKGCHELPNIRSLSPCESCFSSSLQIRCTCNRKGIRRLWRPEALPKLGPLPQDGRYDLPRTLWRNFGVITVLYILATAIASYLLPFACDGGGALIFKKSKRRKKALKAPTPAEEEKSGVAEDGTVSGRTRHCSEEEKLPWRTLLRTKLSSSSRTLNTRFHF